MAIHRALAASAVLALTLGVAGCSLISTREPSASPTPTVSEPEKTLPVETPSPDAGADGDTGDMADRFAERDAFVAAQQLPLDGSLLTATTPEQKEFIANQRAYMESNGIEWSAEAESIYLAAAADGCETAILNGHEIDTADFQAHVGSSPLFAAVLSGLEGEKRTAGEANLASIMVYGMGYMCPADAPQWQAAYDETYR